MGKFTPSPPPAPSGPSQAQLDAQAKADRAAAQKEERANKELSSAARFAKGRRTGRRLLLAPGREDQAASLGGGSGAQSGQNF